MNVIQKLRYNLTDALPDFKVKRALGYRAFSGVENKTNPFFGIMACAALDKDVDYSTSIAVAFAKTPMVMAIEAYSLNQFCRGRFRLGLGSQIKPHIVKRFGMPWSGKPATQMREYVRALHAIWDSFEKGTPIDFHGETYTHTLISPEFVPYDDGFGRPPILIGAVGPGMTKVSADLTDGMITHSFVSERSIREVNVPIIEQALEARGKPRSEFDLILPLFITTGTTQEEYNYYKEMHRERVGFYASTPAYKFQLDLYGWGDLHEEARALTKQGRWGDLKSLISDEMVETFSVCGEPKDIPGIIASRFGGAVDTIRCELELADEEAQFELVKAIEAI